MAKVSETFNPSHLLLVEAEDDKSFFEQICKKLKLNPNIKVAAPRDFQPDYDNPLPNGKQNVLNVLKDLLPDFADDASEIKRLAAIVDADYQKLNGLGFQETLERVNIIAAEYDFILASQQNTGFVFQHSTSIAKFGLWIMPNNQNEGMLEDFIKECIKIEEQPLLNHANTTLTQLPLIKFKSHHTTKAEIATWLAWQTIPGHGLYLSVKDELLNQHHPLFQQLTTWLNTIYA